MISPDFDRAFSVESRSPAASNCGCGKSRRHCGNDRRAEDESATLTFLGQISASRRSSEFGNKKLDSSVGEMLLACCNAATVNTSAISDLVPFMIGCISENCIQSVI
jgi:hypothetical protein